MSDVSLPQTMIFGHIWQSVALAAVLALVLIVGKKMRGSTRYGLSAAAFAAALDALGTVGDVLGEAARLLGVLLDVRALLAVPAAAEVTPQAVRDGIDVDHLAHLVPLDPGSNLIDDPDHLVAVDVRLAHPKQVEVRAVQHEDRLARHASRIPIALAGSNRVCAALAPKSWWEKAPRHSTECGHARDASGAHRTGNRGLYQLSREGESPGPRLCRGIG